eukprot:409151-Karenia_brevis.AAC.1
MKVRPSSAVCFCNDLSTDMWARFGLVVADPDVSDPVSEDAEPPPPSAPPLPPFVARCFELGGGPLTPCQLVPHRLQND